MGFNIKNGVLKRYTEERGVTEVIVPDSVTEIGKEAFSWCSSLTSITLPDSVKEIGEKAFYKCISLTSITFPDSVKEIGESAFEGCSKLTSITLPDSVTEIGGSAFSGTPWLDNYPNDLVIVGNSILIKYKGSDKVVVVPEGVKKIGVSAFSGCSSLTSITLPDSITKIDNSAFFCCSSLTSITLPDSVTEIGYEAFRGCSSLTSITLPDSVTKIGGRAFSGTPWLENYPNDLVIVGNSILIKYKGSDKAVTVPEGVTEIGVRAFMDCSSLTSITLPDSVTEIGEKAFYNCSSLTSINIPNGVKEIKGDVFGGTFSGCSSLTNITLPDSVTKIGGRAFEDCSSLTSITLPDSVTKIGYSAFSRCTSLTSITLPDSVTEIGEHAFYSCSSLTSITLPDSVTEIGEHAFYNCSSLTSITLPDGVTEIGGGAFYNCSSLTSITLPDSVTKIGSWAFSDCKKIEYVYVSIDSPIMSRLGSCNPLVIDKQGEKYRFYVLSFKSSDNSYSDFIKTKHWNNYDLELINNGPKYKYRLPARLFGGLDRLLHPVDLTDENRQFYIELLKKNVKKVITTAEEINCPFAVKALFDLNIIDDSNIKAVKKLLTASAIPEIAALAELCGSEAEKPKTKKKSAPKKEEPKAHVDPLTAEYREKLTSIKGNDIIKKMKLIGTKFPDVKLQNGTNAPDELFKFIVASCGASDNYTINEEADKAAALLSYDSLCDAIAAISNGLDLTLYPSIIPVVCRFGNPDQIKAVLKYYDTLKGAKGKSIQSKIKSALAMSDTRVAVLWLEKNGGLSEFARAHKICEEQVYDKYLYDFGFDEQGKRVFNLGTTTIEATISPELTLSLVNTATGKAVRSIPKKGIAPDVQKKAADELADMKATLKKTAKLKNDQLFRDYIDAAETPGAEWKDRYTKNPFLSAIARILVWSQDGKTFTLVNGKATDAQGRELSITEKPIKLAHTMEMDREDIEAWRTYFTDNKLKQPFIQIWEPVIDKSFVSDNRYKDCPIRDYYLKKQEKRGIYIEWYSGYYSESHYLSIEGFDVDYDNVIVDDHDMVEITSIKPKKWNRRANMIISFLDRITFYGRILKDDPTIGTLLDSFTLPQIMSFIDLAAKNNCTNATAVLLNYRNEHYPEYDGFAALDDLILDDDF